MTERIFQRVVFGEELKMDNVSFEEVVERIKQIALNRGYRTRISYPNITSRFSVRFSAFDSLATGLQRLADTCDCVLLLANDGTIGYASLIERLNGIKFITINGKQVAFEGDTMSYEQLAELAYPNTDATNYALTAIYHRGELPKPSGVLLKGKPVPVRDGMSFDIIATGNA
jgi:hypothetical protein